MHHAIWDESRCDMLSMVCSDKLNPSDPGSPALDHSHETIITLFDLLRVARAAFVVILALPPQPL
jgi:hypothetical protein